MQPALDCALALVAGMFWLILYLLDKAVRLHGNMYDVLHMLLLLR